MVIHQFHPTKITSLARRRPDARASARASPLFWATRPSAAPGRQGQGRRVRRHPAAQPGRDVDDASDGLRVDGTDEFTDGFCRMGMENHGKSWKIMENGILG